MKMNISALARLAVLLICPLLLTFNVQMVVPIESANDTGMKYGINYLSTHWHYQPYYLSDEEIERDFSLFREQGLEYVSLVAVWKYLEPALGTYNDEALNDLKRVCESASKHEMKVIIDFHTMMQENSFTMPDWLSPRKFETVFTNNTVRGAWLNFLDHCVSYLGQISNIHSWQMMNEPALGEWACNVSVDEFVGLWTEMRSVFKSHSEKPVSIRFGANTFDKHFQRDPRIYEICDYVALNWYEDYCTRGRLSDIVAEIRAHRMVMLSEFGYQTDDDELQTDVYAEYLGLFKSIGVSYCTAFFWRADYTSPNPTPPGFGFNLAKNVEGEPRSAFCLLDAASPAITVRSPERKTYAENCVLLTFTTSEQTSWIGYCLDEQSNVTITTNTTIASLAEGVHALVLYGNDSLGNMGFSETILFTIDTVSPITDSVLSGSLGRDGWYASDVLVRLIATDAVSGVASTSYSLDGVAWANYTAAFTISAEGVTLIYYNSTDNARNSENTENTTVRVDKTMPLVPAISSSSHPDQEEWYSNRNPSFNWAVPVDRSGIAGYSLDLDQTPSTSPSESIETTENSRSYNNLPHGIWYFHVRARDCAGNWGPTAHYSIRLGCSIRFESRQDIGSTQNWGAITFNATQTNLPFEGCVSAGTGQATYNQVSGYIFDHWESTGGVYVSNVWDSTTAITVSDDGTLRAVYKACSLLPYFQMVLSRLAHAVRSILCFLFCLICVCMKLCPAHLSFSFW